MNNLTNILYTILLFVRFAGIIIVAILGMAFVITEGARSKLSPGKLLGVAASTILAAFIFWTLPSLVNYTRSDSRTVIPDHPIGGYR